MNVQGEWFGAAKNPPPPVPPAPPPLPQHLRFTESPQVQAALKKLKEEEAKLRSQRKQMLEDLIGDIACFIEEMFDWKVSLESELSKWSVEDEAQAKSEESS